MNGGKYGVNCQFFTVGCVDYKIDFSPQRRKGTKEHEGNPFANLCAFAPLWQK